MGLLPILIFLTGRSPSRREGLGDEFTSVTSMEGTPDSDGVDSGGGGPDSSADGTMDSVLCTPRLLPISMSLLMLAAGRGPLLCNDTVSSPAGAALRTTSS